MNETDSPKAGIPQNVLLGLGAVAIIIVVGLIIYFFRASDPAARAPVPYKKFDYGAHMQEQKGTLNRQTPSDPSSSR